MDQLLAALADPARRLILEQLRAGERSAGEVERALGLAQPAASKHLRALRLAGLVRVRTDAQRRIYALDARPLAALDAWLDHYRVFWEARLDALADHLQREE